MVVTVAALGARESTASLCCLLFDTQPLWSLLDERCLEVTAWNLTVYMKAGTQRKENTSVPWTALSLAIDGQVTSQLVGVGCVPLSCICWL